MQLARVLAAHRLQVEHLQQQLAERDTALDQLRSQARGHGETAGAPTRVQGNARRHTAVGEDDGEAQALLADVQRKLQV